MSLRTVADDTPRLCRSTSALDPIGSLVATKSATMARSTSKRRSSAIPMRTFYGDPRPARAGPLPLGAPGDLLHQFCRRIVGHDPAVLVDERDGLGGRRA